MPTPDSSSAGLDPTAAPADGLRPWEAPALAPLDVLAETRATASNIDPSEFAAFGLYFGPTITS